MTPRAKPPPVDPRIAPLEPEAPWISRHVRRPIKRLLNGFVDRGVFGLRALHTHIVISGFPRGGTTLVQAIFESCVNNARIFHSEVRALSVADHALRNHHWMISKRPDDLFAFDDIRDFYQDRPAACQFILVTRDPRDVLTSRHTSSQSPYVPPVRWRWFYQYWKYERDRKDVFCFRYEDLVRQPDVIERKVVDRLDCSLRAPFAEYHKHLSPRFDARAMHRVRPLDPSSVGRWRRPEHRHELMRLVESELPELPDALIEMGYETDCAWLDDESNDAAPHS